MCHTRARANRLPRRRSGPLPPLAELHATPARAAEPGEVVQVDNVGVPLYSHNFDTGKDSSVGDKLSIAEFFGAHYFVTSRVRVGMMVQLTEQFTGDLALMMPTWHGRLPWQAGRPAFIIARRRSASTRTASRRSRRTGVPAQGRPT